MKTKEISHLEATYRHLCNNLSDLNELSGELLSFCDADEYNKFLTARSLLTDLTFDVSSRLSVALKSFLCK